MENKIISVNGLSRSFGKTKALDSVSFDVEKGSITGLIGKNGAGKTTLIKCLLGLLKPGSGSCTVMELAPTKFNNSARQKLGYVSQNSTLIEWMTVEELIKYTASFYENWNNRKVMELVSQWNLPVHNITNQLSTGEQQKLSLILSMGHEPDLYILDEPVASFDPISRRQFIKDMIDINIEKNSTIIFSTHITSDLERIAGDIVHLKEGKVDFSGDLSALQEEITSFRVSSDQNLPEALDTPGIIRYEKHDNRAKLVVRGMGTDKLNDLENRYSLKLEEVPLNLEEIFIELNR